MSSRVTFVKTDSVLSAMNTYTVLLDGEPIGALSKVRDRYLRRVGHGRGQNVPTARDAWIVEGKGHSVHHDTRAEAAIALVSETQGIGYGDALDIVRAKS